MFVSTARVRGRYVLRLCVLNHSTSQAEVDRCLELAATLPVDTRSRPAVPCGRATPSRGRLASAVQRSTLEGLRSLALFASLDVDQAERVLLGCAEQRALPGEAIVEQWQVSRDLYVVLERRSRGQRRRLTLATLGPGDFFGELAAIEWGAGFARTRSATVTATGRHACSSSTGSSSTG